MRGLRLKLAWLVDWLIPVRKGQVSFVSRRNVPINGNLRVMLDALAKEPGLRVIAYKEAKTSPETAAVLRRSGVELINRFSLKALIILLSSELVVLSHSARDAYISYRKSGRKIINLWHGVAIKRIEAMMLPKGSRRAYHLRQRRIRQNGRIYDAMIACNSIDQLVISLAFGVPHEIVYPIGLPRFDYLLLGAEHWPEDLQADQKAIENQLNGRQLILYAPTFRDSNRLATLINKTDIEIIRQYCIQHNSVMGLRPHPYWEGQQLRLCDGEHVINLGSSIYPESAVVLNRADILVTDYSSIWIDFLLLNRPIVSYVPDLQAYLDKDRGLIYDLHDSLPGIVAQSWPAVLKAIESCPMTAPSDRQQTIFLPNPHPGSQTIIERCKALCLEFLSCHQP